METNASAAQLKIWIGRVIAFFTAVSLCLTIGGCGSGGSKPSPRTLSSLAITPTNISVTVGNSQQLTATGTYSDGTTANLSGSVSWTSSDTSIVTVSSAGLVSSVALGTAMITRQFGQHQYAHEPYSKPGAGFDCCNTGGAIHSCQCDAAIQRDRNL